MDCVHVARMAAWLRGVFASGPGWEDALSEDEGFPWEVIIVEFVAYIAW